MSKKNTTMYIILGLLTHESLTGYDINKSFSQGLSYFWDLSYGQIYPTLKQLEKNDYVEKHIEINEHGQNKKIYTITKKGTKELKQWLETPVEKEVFKYEILVKLFFGTQVPIQTSIDNLKQFKERNQENLVLMNQYEKRLISVVKQNSDHFYFLTTVLLGKRIYQAHIKWADEIIQMLKEKGKEQTK